MFKIKDNIYEAIKNSEIQIEEICIQDCDDIRKMISQKYCRNAGKTDVLWDDLLEYSSISDADAWKLFKCMVKRECILFFNKSDENCMFKIKTGSDLDYILSETYGFEFYVTDMECSYLLCFNHHDILYGCGLAYEWLKLYK